LETAKQKTVSRAADKAAASLLKVAGNGHAVSSRSSVNIQASLKVSHPKDPAEVEAVGTAKKVMRMSIPESTVSMVKSHSGAGVFREVKKDDKDKKIQRSQSAYLSRFAVNSISREAVKKDDSDKKKIQRFGASTYIARFAGTGIFRDAVKKEEKDKKVQRYAESLSREAVKKDDTEKKLQREAVKKEEKDKKIQRKIAGTTPDVGANVMADIQNAQAGGGPLPLSVRKFMEPRFNADFSTVKVHTDDKAAKMNRQVGAHAFALGNNIFFGKDKFKPETHDGKELIAHELTHTIQQSGATQNAPVQRAEDASVSQQSPAMVQRGLVSEVLDYFAEKAYLIPGYRMFCVIIGVNVINMSTVERSGANILRAIIEFIPGGALLTQALDNHGLLDKAGAWVDQQFRSLGMVGSSFKAALDQFIDSLGLSDVFHLGSVWDRAKRIFTEPVGRLIDFARGLLNGFIKLIKDAILRPLAGLAQNTRGWDLLCAVLGQNPITGDPVPRTADTLIGGFMKLIGQEEIWNNIKKANAIPRAWAWFQTALSGLMALVRSIPTRFIDGFRSLELMDIVVLPRAFLKIGAVFASFIGDFLSWAGGTIWSLLEIIFAVVAPGVMPYLKKAQATFRTIIRNPVGFIGNLVRAAMLGFRQFAANFLTHLRNSLIQWLTGALPGVYIPTALNLREIIKFVLSVLGLTWANIREKLVRVMGETAVKAMETGFDIVVTLVTQGPAAAWEKIKETLSNLQQMVIDGVMEFVRSRIVQAAVTRLLSMLSPAGAFIQAIIAIYNTIMFFVERLRQIAQVAASFIDSISAIANGSLAAAANRVETTMAGLLTLVISFLARIAGLGRVSDAVMNIINRVRAPIDRALDRVVDWIVNMARRLGRFVRNTAASVVQWWRNRKSFTDNDGQSHNLYFQGEAVGARLMVASTVMEVSSAIALARTKSPNAAQTAAINEATRLKNEATTIIARLQTTAAGGYNPQDITDVNRVLNDLSNQMKIIVPLIAPPPATSPSTIGIAVGELISYNGRHWIVAAFDKSIQGLDTIKLKRLIPAIKSSNADGFLVSTFGRDLASGKVSVVNSKLTKRDLYMGATNPSVSAIKARMQSMGKFNPVTNQFKSRDGKWYPVSQGDKGHVIDASVWWNSNGRFKGPKAPEVRSFMTDADNYELEERSSNQSRGASSPNYLPPAI
jgi:hypothetical protein